MTLRDQLKIKNLTIEELTKEINDARHAYWTFTREGLSRDQVFGCKDFAPIPLRALIQNLVRELVEREHGLTRMYEILDVYEEDLLRKEKKQRRKDHDY